MTWVRSEKIFFTCPSRLVSLAIFFSLSLWCFGCSLCCLHCLCVSDRGAGFLLFCCCWSLIKPRLLLLPFFVVSITKLIKLLLFSRSLFFFPGWSLESYLLRASWLGFLSCLEASTLEAVFCFISFSFFPICRSVKAAVRERERELQSFFFRTRLSCLLQVSDIRSWVFFSSLLFSKCLGSSPARLFKFAVVLLQSSGILLQFGFVNVVVVVVIFALFVISAFGVSHSDLQLFVSLIHSFAIQQSFKLSESLWFSFLI